MGTLKEELAKVRDSEMNKLDDHLGNVFSRLLLENPKNAFEAFEDYSHAIKLQHYNYKNPSQYDTNACRIRENNGELKAYTEVARKLFDKLTDGSEEPQEIGAQGYVPNFMEEAKWFEQAGVGFGEEDSYKIFKSLTALTYKKQLKQVRLWGKIIGSQKDYFIAEGVVEGGEEGEQPPNVELKGAKGINKLNYFVTNELTEEWTELPIVTPEQLVISRRIKRIFTGNLESEVITNPHFEGKEKHLLKCQIVRITYTTTIIPSGLFVTNADDPREIEAPEEEKKFPDFDTLTKIENWVHHTENILKEGRVTHFKPDNLPEDTDEEKWLAQQIANDPFEQRLKSLANDKAPEGYKSSWIIKKHGDTSTYALPQKEAAQTSYGFISIKNLFWPGHVTIYHRQQWQNLYIGYGFKISNTLYFPQEPELILEEQPELLEQNEPNFPVEVQHVEGEEKKGEEEEQEQE